MPNSTSFTSSLARPSDLRPATVGEWPKRTSGDTNLTRSECAWRSVHLQLTELAVDVDVSGAGDRERRTFPVRSALTVQVEPAEAAGAVGGTHEAEGDGDGQVDGLWVDFLGESVDAVTVDGRRVRVDWDGARVMLPALPSGRHVVEIVATGKYSTSGQGLHRFHDPVDGATYLYTHFEPSDARRAWPCLEQPDEKAPFILTVRHPAGWSVLANGRPSVQATDDGQVPRRAGDAVVTTMGPTRPLPSYLTAMAAGPWHRVEGQWRSSLRPEDAPVPLSWSCRASLAEHLDAEELLEVTCQGLDLYDQTYAYPYPWGSYDCVLVPEYNIGAMENPGCVTFNEEQYLFRGPATDAQHAGRANTILHEMCHMWFGDLVTPRWWEDTWLKESFAENQGAWAQASVTAWPDAWVAFALGRKAWAYTEDSRPSTTHPILATVEDVEAARQAFDGITYAKGAAVLKQLVAAAGQDAFVAAARTWFAEHAFGNGDLTEFLETLSAATGQDMASWARAWLGTAGPSVLTGVLEHDGEVITRLEVTQEAVDPSTGEQALRPHTLVVGLYSFDDAGRLSRTHRLPVVLEGEVAEVPGALGLAAPDLVTVNDEDLTYAVVRPDPTSLATARTALGRLDDPLAQAVWWSSLSNLVRDGLLSPAVFTATVLSQTDPAQATRPVGSTLATLLTQARRYAVLLADGEASVAALQPLAGDPAWGLLEAAEPGSDAQLVRARAWMEAAGQARLLGPQTAQECARRLRALLSGHLEGLVVDADVRWRVVTALARLGLVTDEELTDGAQADPTASGRIRYLLASSSRPDAGTKQRLWERIMTDTSVSNDELDALIAGFAVDGHRDLLSGFTERYLDAVEQVWSSRGQEMATRVLRGLFPALGDRQDVEAVEAWLDGAGASAPAAARRLVCAGRDDLARAVAVREAVSVPAGA